MMDKSGPNQKHKQPIIIKRTSKQTDNHHGGGAWKVAYADFITALMAFFLLMWLLISTTPTQRISISAYFKHKGSTSPIMGPGGASTSMIKLGGTKDLEPNPSQQQSKDIVKQSAGDEHASHQAMQTLEAQLKRAIENSQALRPFKDQLLLDITPNGLRLQIVDKQNRPMFALGSAKLLPYARAILEQVGAFLSKYPYKISVTGETDATKYSDPNMSNWQLSTARANAAWRAMVVGGYPREQIIQVIGFGDKILFDKMNPQDPINRRISIVVLTENASDALLKNAALK